MPVWNQTTGFWPTWRRVFPRQWVWSERRRRWGSSRDSRLAPGGAGRYGTDWVLGTAPLAERQSSPGRRPGRIHWIPTGSATPVQSGQGLTGPTKMSRTKAVWQKN